MSEKKGLFGRLIDWAQQAPEKDTPETLPDLVPVSPGPVPEPQAPIPAAGPQPVAPVAPPLDIPLQPTPMPIETPHTAPAGPPEATPDFIEKVEADIAAEPEEVEDTPLPADQPDPIVPPPLEPVAATTAPRLNWFQRLATGLKRSSDQLTGGITALFTKSKLDGATLDDLEDILIGADFGIETASTITDALRRERFERGMAPEEVRRILSVEVEKILKPVARPLVIDSTQKPFVILMAGVNGSGKTTTIGKLSQKLAAEGKSVMLAAGDTFRAAAIEQLQVWGKRTGAPVIARPAGSDASGLAFDAVTEAVKQGVDVLIIDTAGRLQNRDELMGELEKILRVIKKVLPSAPHATLLTLDATTGQNALNQVEIFGQRAGITGLVMTKLDGTARGGILVAIARRFGLPVHYIGVGEGVDDLEPFTAGDFAAAIAGLEAR